MLEGKIFINIELPAQDVLCDGISSVLGSLYFHRSGQVSSDTKIVGSWGETKPGAAVKPVVPPAPRADEPNDLIDSIGARKSRVTIDEEGELTRILIECAKQPIGIGFKARLEALLKEEATRG